MNYIDFRLSSVDVLGGVELILQLFVMGLALFAFLMLISFLTYLKASSKRVEDFRKATHSVA